MQTTTVGVLVSYALSNALVNVTENDETFGWTATDKYIDALKAVLPEVEGNNRRIVEMCINYPDTVRLVDIDETFDGVFAVVSSNFQYRSVDVNGLKLLAESCNRVANCIRAHVQGDDANELVNRIELISLQY